MEESSKRFVSPTGAEDERSNRTLPVCMSTSNPGHLTSAYRLHAAHSVPSRLPLVERLGGYAECVPRPRRDLTTTEKRHLHSLEGRISRLEAELQATRREWAELVEEAGQAAVARELGVSRQAVADRLRRIRANREGRSGRR